MKALVLMLMMLSLEMAKADSLTERTLFNTKAINWIRQNQSNQYRNTPPPTTPTPMPALRKVATKVTLFRTKVVKQADGTFTLDSKVICTVNSQAEFYDFRTPDGGYIPFVKLADCQTEWKGQPAHMFVSGFGGLSNSRVHPNESATDLKSFYAVSVISVDPASPAISEFIGQQESYSRDISLQSVILKIGQFPSLVCDDPKDNSTCHASRDESYDATVEFMDTP